MSDEAYVLITPARNEDAFIGKTIQAVISQTLLPRKWVIVSDGSTDRTDDIVKSYLNKHRFILFIRTSEKDRRDFSSKVDAINTGYKLLKQEDYDFIGNLDADISFDRDYYEKILEKFKQNKNLGIAGGSRYDIYDGKREEVIRSRNSVMGAVQLFRRQCYEDIGGYLPLEGGGIDAVAEIMARMHGWQVETFPEIMVNHYRRTGTANSNVLRARFHDGKNDYLIGYHPVFELFRSISRVTTKPFCLGSLFLFSGYCWAYLRRYKKQVQPEVIKYIRTEQMSRIRTAILPRKKS